MAHPTATPYYFYDESQLQMGNHHHDINNTDDPPPSYTSDSPPSSVSSPRSSQAGDTLLLSSTTSQNETIDISSGVVGRLGRIGVDNNAHNSTRDRNANANTNTDTTGPKTSSSSSSSGGSSTTSSSGFHSRSSLSASASVTDDGDYGISSDSEFGGAVEASGRSLRFGLPSASLIPGEVDGLFSRLGSRAVSPAPPQAGPSSSPSSSSTHHHHIHHHYHHADAAAAAPPSGSTTAIGGGLPSSSSSSCSPSIRLKGKERDLSASTGSVGPAPASVPMGSRRSSRTSNHSACTSADYAVPSDSYFASHHYRSGPLARKLGAAVLSRDPSLTELPLLNSISSAASPLSSSAYRKRSGWKSPRRKITDAFDDGTDWSHLDTSIPMRTRRRFSAFVPPSVIKGWQRFVRHPLVPTQPLTILFALSLFACFAYSLTTFIYHVLSTDKSPRPWRTYCQEQRPFPHDLADSLAPVDVFVGIFSVDAAYERRHLIRSTYLRHSKPIDPLTGKPATNIQLKFILGRPRKHHARRIALEMETYNDIVVLDIKENMNKGKTHQFFKWANENATVPIYYKPPNGGKRIGSLDPVDPAVESYNLAFKKADYVVKADDDSFLVLSELERHLRVAPRQGTYWGYLIRNLFMGGECYALSADLVNYVATYPALEAYTTGAEDKRVAKWMRMHPNASSINWITERCYVYDHPKASTTYSHGFLFPDEVERVRAEGRVGISLAEKQRRGGDILAEAWSSVSKWKKPYIRPKAEMTMEEEVEALVEGGGRWSALDNWTNKLSEKDVVKYESVVFDSQDERIKGAKANVVRADQARSEHWSKSESAFGKYNRMPNSLLRDPGDTNIRPQHAKRSTFAFWKRGNTPASSSEQDGYLTAMPPANASTEADGSKQDLPSSEEERQHYQDSHVYAGQGYQFPIGSSPRFKQGYSFLPDAPANPDSYKDKAIPAPTPRYDPDTMSLRERRFLGLPYGGTVVVHYLKRNEWFLETALALLGREKMWDGGHDTPAHPPYIPPVPPGKHIPDHHRNDRPDADGGAEDGHERERKEVQIKPVPTWNGKGEVDIVPPEWGGARMYGSPLIKENGYVALGRTVPWDALEKSEGLRYGNLKGSPKQRYADPQHPIGGNPGSSSSSSPFGSSPADAPSSSSFEIPVSSSESLARQGQTTADSSSSIDQTSTSSSGTPLSDAQSLKPSGNLDLSDLPSTDSLTHSHLRSFLMSTAPEDFERRRHTHTDDTASSVSSE